MSSATMTQAVPAPGTFKVIAAASIGNALEWYDILVYGYFAVTSGLELAGIKMIWRVNHLPNFLSFTSRDALSLRLILMEALSNVMHHAHAKTVTLSATYDKAVHLLAITVADDGCGFVAPTLSEGAGLNNMQARARKLTWQTTIHVDSEPGKGTAVQIKIEPPADVGTTD
jgi:signal transduction histidine kinase